MAAYKYLICARSHYVLLCFWYSCDCYYHKISITQQVNTSFQLSSSYGHVLTLFVRWLARRRSLYRRTWAALAFCSRASAGAAGRCHLSGAAHAENQRIGVGSLCSSTTRRLSSIICSSAAFSIDRSIDRRLMGDGWTLNWCSWSAHWINHRPLFISR